MAGRFGQPKHPVCTACFGSGNQSQLKLVLLVVNSGQISIGSIHRFDGPLTLYIHIRCYGLLFGAVCFQIGLLCMVFVG